MSVREEPDRVVLRLPLDRPPAAAWAALTDPRRVALWWGAHVSLDATPGGRLLERWTDAAGRPVETSGRVTACEPPRLLGLTWADDGWPATTAVALRLDPAGDGGTLLTLEHAGWDRFPDPGQGAKLRAEHAAGWARHLRSLRRHLRAPEPPVTATRRLVVFDCDGTLVDSQAAIVACAREAFAAEGLEPPPAQAVRRIIGLSLVPAVLRLMPAPDLARAERLADRYREAFQARRAAGDADGDDPLFPGAREAIEALASRGLLLGVATGKSMRGLRHVLGRHGLLDRFATLQTADHHPSKPHPAMLEAAMAEAGAAPSETVLVGDTTFDVLMARAAGVLPVGVAWGYHPEAELRAAGAAHMLVGFDQLPDLLAP